MEYILKGDPKEVAKILQENRIRVDRGVIEFTPCQPGPVLDADSIATLQEDLDAKTKACMEMAASQVELASIIRELVAVTAKGGMAIPDDLAARLSKFGFTVPKIAETVPNTAEIADNADNAGESVPEVVPNEPETVEDNKVVEAEDMTEVDLDDVKDTEETDTKEAPAPTPKKTRSKNHSNNADRLLIFH